MDKKIKAILKIIFVMILTIILFIVYLLISNTKKINYDKNITIEMGKTENINVPGTYKSLDENIVTIDKTGKIIAVNVGKTQIEITTNNKVYISTITVKEPSEDITLRENNITLELNEQYEINPILKSNVNIKSYIIEDENIISIENNTINAKKIGNCKITITTNTNKSVILNVNVVKGKLKNISLNKMKLELKPSQTMQLYIYTNPSYYESENIKWTSTNEDVVEVTNGKVIAKKEGSAKVKAQILDKTIECLIIVSNEEKKVTSFKLNEISLTLSIGEKERLIPTITPNISIENIKWTSTNENIAKVDNGNVTAISQGKAVITGTIDSKSYSTVINVTNNKSNYLKELITNSKYTKEEILEYFNETVLNVEKGTKENIVQKWNSPIYYYYDENATKEDIKHIETLISKLNEIPSLPVFIKSKLENANLIINFPSYIELYNMIGEKGIEGFCTYDFNDNNIITSANIKISSDLESETKKSVITEEIVQALGIPNDSKKYRDSIFYSYASDTIYPNSLDYIIINLLYNTNIKYGMNYQTVEKELNAIIK